MRRLQVIWEDDALADLADLVHRDRRRAEMLERTIRHIGATGWAYMGRPTRGGLLYFTVPPFGVFYRLRRAERQIMIVQVVDARWLPELP